MMVGARAAPSKRNREDKRYKERRAWLPRPMELDSLVADSLSSGDGKGSSVYVFDLILTYCPALTYPAAESRGGKGEEV